MLRRAGPGAAVVALLLGGCPAPGTTENPLNVPVGGPPVVSVCYAALVTDRAGEIEQVAREACAAAGVGDATLRYWRRDVILNECPLLKKNRISYFCLPAAAAEEEEDGGIAEPAPPAGDDEGGDAADPAAPAGDDGSDNGDGD